MPRTLYVVVENFWKNCFKTGCPECYIRETSLSFWKTYPGDLLDELCREAI